MKVFSTALALLFSYAAFSQAPLNPNHEKLTAAFSNYFKMDRENIHVHFNKNSYLTTDEIWFKGYVTEKKHSAPYLKTSNILVTVLNGNGEKIKNLTFFSENSLFEGNIKLDDDYTTGNYFLHFYTNYMNNFIEDESSLYEIKIINPKEKKLFSDSKIIDYNSLTTTFYPEANLFLQGTSNTIAVKITDCNGNGLIVKDGQITNAKGEVVTTFSTNEMGYGKFEIVQTKNELYKAVFMVNSLKTEKPLPLPTANGINFSVNNYTFEEKTNIKIKTNSNGLNTYKNEPFTFVVQQNNKASFVDFTFKGNSSEELISIANSNIPEGINTLYLLDKNQNKIAERIIYMPSTRNKFLNLNITKTKGDTITIKGSSSLKLGDLSISVLPSVTNAIDFNKDIFNSLELNNYLSETPANTSYYFTNFSKQKHYELDLFLICQKSKYDWKNIVGSAPEEKFEFDNGFSFKGKINTPISDYKNYRVQLSSIQYGLSEYAAVDDKNEFNFKNILMGDEGTAHFMLLDKRNKNTDLRLFTQALNNNRPFIKKIKLPNVPCAVGSLIKSEDDSDFPSIAGAIRLENINIQTKSKKPESANNHKFNNNMSKYFKISENDENRYLHQFIAANGYDVRINGDTLGIAVRNYKSFSASRTPLIYIDDVLYAESEFNQLINFSLKNVDEIYINNHGYGGGAGASSGIIRVYTKKGAQGIRKILVNSKAFTLKIGYLFPKKFINPKFTNFDDEGFKKYGTIHWIPFTPTDEKGEFTFNIPNYNQKSVKIIVEGIGSTGELISETKILEIP